MLALSSSATQAFRNAELRAAIGAAYVDMHVKTPASKPILGKCARGIVQGETGVTSNNLADITVRKCGVENRD
jgi:hypothetical protein